MSLSTPTGLIPVSVEEIGLEHFRDNPVLLSSALVYLS